MKIEGRVLCQCSRHQILGPAVQAAMICIHIVKQPDIVFDNPVYADFNYKILTGFPIWCEGCEECRDKDKAWEDAWENLGELFKPICVMCRDEILAASTSVCNSSIICMGELN